VWLPSQPLLRKNGARSCEVLEQTDRKDVDLPTGIPVCKLSLVSLRWGANARLHGCEVGSFIAFICSNPFELIPKHRDRSSRYRQRLCQEHSEQLSSYPDLDSNRPAKFGRAPTRRPLLRTERKRDCHPTGFQRRWVRRVSNSSGCASEQSSEQFRKRFEYRISDSFYKFVGCHVAYSPQLCRQRPTRKRYRSHAGLYAFLRCCSIPRTEAATASW
jgi:hypothetical protein